MEGEGKSNNQGSGNPYTTIFFHINLANWA